MFSCGKNFFFRKKKKCFQRALKRSQRLPFPSRESCVVATVKGTQGFFFIFFLLLFSSLAVRSEQEVILLLHSSYQDHNCLFFFLSPIAFSHSPKTLDCLIFPLLYRYFPHLFFFFSFLAASCATSSWNQNKLPRPKQTFFQSKLGSSLAPRAFHREPRRSKVIPLASLPLKESSALA